MPNDGLERFRMRRDRLRVHRRNDAAGVRRLRRIASIAPDDACDLGADALGIFDRLDEIGADVLLQVAAAYGEDKESVLRLKLADLQPLGEDRRPSLIVGARGQLRNVVGRRIGIRCRRSCGSR